MIEPKYKIVKRVVRYDDGEIRFYFDVYKYTKTLFGKMKWKQCKRTNYGFGDVYKEDVVFNTEEKAREYVDNMMKPLPPEEEIIFN